MMETLIFKRLKKANQIVRTSDFSEENEICIKLKVKCIKLQINHPFKPFTFGRHRY